MKIAFLTPYLPFPPDTGGKIRSFNLIKQLARQHQLDVFSVFYGDAPAQADDIRALCSRLSLFRLTKSFRVRDRVKRFLSAMPRSVDNFHTLESIHTVRACLASGSYDLVFVDELVMSIYTTGLKSIPRILSQQKVDYWHYFETATARPWGPDKLQDYLESLKLRHFQAQALRDAYNLHLVCSHDDEQMLRKIQPDIRIVVMPNGVETAEFLPRTTWPVKSTTDAPTLIYSGTMHYYPNIDAMLYFCKEIFPRIARHIPQTRLLVVGHNPPPAIVRLAANPNITVTGSVPSVLPFLGQSHVMVVPLRLGGGTRLKILEALAAGLPVVSTSVGAQGLNLKAGEEIMIADTPDEFAARTVQLLSSVELRRHMSTLGRAAAAKYDWRDLVQKMMSGWQSQ